MNTEHSTPLHSHLKQWVFWTDVALLIGATLLLSIVDGMPERFYGVDLKSFLRLIVAFSIIDVLTFFLSHLGKKSRWLTSRNHHSLRGFLAGWVSSTATFFRTLTLKSAALPTAQSQALLLNFALLAMTLQMLLIAWTSLGWIGFLGTVPVGGYLLGILIEIFLLNRGQPSAEPLFPDTVSTIPDRPIVWRHVLPLSIILFFLVLSLRWAHEKLDLPTAWGAGILSLFEAHAAFAASLNALGSGDWREILFPTFAVLTGHSVSKLILIEKFASPDLARRMRRSLILSWSLAGLVLLAALLG